MADSVLGLEGFSGAVQIGHGGYGVVYRAVQDDLHRTVAVKVLAGGPVEAGARRRFDRERLALGALSGHPAIVTVHQSGFNAAGRPYLVMELMSGGSLAERLTDSGRMPWQEALAIGAQIADGLETAHAAGLLHRDVKPENLLISQFGEVKLADFGIASLTEGSMSATHTVTATVAHAAPEVLEGQRPSAASDVYSLGSTLFALISGRAAFRHETDESVVPMLTRVLTAPVPDLRPLGVPDAVASVLERSMSKEPDARYASAREFRAALQAAAATEGVALPPPGVVIGSQTVREELAHTVHEPPDPTVHERPESVTVHDATGAALLAGRSVASGAGDTAFEATAPGAVTSAGPPPPPAASLDSARPRRRRRQLVVAIIAAVAVIGSAVAAVALTGDDSKNKSEAEVQGKQVSRGPRSTVDRTPPTIRITAPPDGYQTIFGQEIVKGVIEPASDANGSVRLVTVNEAAVPTAPAATIAANGTWEIRVNLVLGENRLGFVATDVHGNKSVAVATKLILVQLPASTTTTSPPRRSSGGNKSGGVTTAPQVTTQAPQQVERTPGGTPDPGPQPNPLADLAQACYGGNFGACDQLYLRSDAGTAYEDYGAQCGQRALLGVKVGGYGHCAEFFGLADSCYYDNMGSCDSLYINSRVGSGFEKYGETCGNRVGTGLPAGHPAYCVYWRNSGQV
jgi:serine/threonine protein kinase